MVQVSSLVPVFLGYVALQVSEVLAELTSDQCLDLGFNRANLLCSYCKELPDFNLNALRENCSKCCTADSGTPEIQRYPRALLEVCG